MDSQEFRNLAMAELDAVYRMALCLTRRQEDAADLTQETYLRALRAENRFELREQGIRPWLFKIMHNTFYTRVGREQHAPSAVSDIGTLAEAPTEGEPAWDLESLDWEQVDQRLKHAIDELPEHYRIVLLLWAVEGMKYREIAETIGVPLGTVMSRLYRARTVLSDQLRELAEEHGIAAATVRSDH